MPSNSQTTSFNYHKAALKRIAMLCVSTENAIAILGKFITFFTIEQLLRRGVSTELIIDSHQEHEQERNKELSITLGCKCSIHFHHYLRKASEFTIPCEQISSQCFCDSGLWLPIFGCGTWDLFFLIFFFFYFLAPLCQPTNFFIWGWWLGLITLIQGLNGTLNPKHYILCLW